MAKRAGAGFSGAISLVTMTALATLAACSSTTEPGGATGTGGSTGSGGRGGSSGTGGSTGTGGSGSKPDAGADAPMDMGSADAGPAIQLKIAWWGSMDRHTRTIKVLEAFTKKHPNITFSHEYDASTPYWAKMNERAANDTLPDIMQQDYAYIGEWTEKGRLLPLDDFAKAGGPLDVSDIAPSILAGGRIGGKLMGMSLGSNTQCWVLDADVFTAAQVALPTDTWTWENFEDAATKIKTTQNIWGYGAALYLYTPWKALFLSAGEWVFTPDNKAIGWTSDKPWVDHWKREVRMQKAGIIPTYDQEKTEFPEIADVTKLPIITKRAAMEQIHSNQLLAISNAAPNRNFKLVAVPRLTGGGSSVYVKPSQYFSVVAKTKYAKEAAMVIDFFTNDLEANNILEAERGVPVAGKVLAALKPKLGKAQVEAFELIDRVAKDARALPPPDPAAWSTILSTVYLPKVTIPILREQLSPEDGVALFKLEANAILAGMPIEGGADGSVDGVDGAADGGADGPDAGGDALPDGIGDASGFTALLVVGAVPVVGKDLVLKARLELKMGVEVVLDSAATTEMATGKAVVIISATAGLANVNTKFRDVAVPVLTTEPNILPIMGMTADLATDHDGLGAQTKITIVAANATHAMAAGLSGDVTIFAAPSRVTFGIPGPGALKVASVLGMPTQSTIFSYASGSMMVGRTAPAKRILFFLHDSDPLVALTDDGLKLLDAAIDWAVVP